ncbi:MAG: YggS family pyridoxal phosphate-dependent enzyme [Ignavibacteria bacterium]|nr:YggS family pyridoxal phosphate-dependent enzyme [Ignavibacteria bacterium]
MIAENIHIIRERMQNACTRSGRNISEVTLIGVSKTVGVPEVVLAHEAGLLQFGENKAQELRDKSRNLPTDITWHFIGTLQSNKAKYVAEAAHWVHSVDSLKLAQALQEQAERKNRALNVLFEVKTSAETTKHGLTELADVFETLDYCMNASHLHVRGLMTMAPFVDDMNIVRKSFRQLKELQMDLHHKGYPVTELSMGMTGDFEIAIEEGATMIRVGTAIFGERNYNL